MAASNAARAARPVTKPAFTRAPAPALPYKGTTPAAPPVGLGGQLPQSLRPPVPKRVDLSSPAYKAASRKYVSVMIATPILLVTSYVLFDRLVMGKEAKSLQPKAAAQDVI
ncbi:uncharacterized protein JN550_011857 [Neoarthrinium moseri]|uniref:uncharacterized protein n=1 Tax=Neoarthrinium moseri TaxID=1658444 RepID=UPI001FDC5090|nr:uncharacterized protein JN550_011857 [Neoarthrinium moseri]KAI1859662.1 hypothetical protein JN550_011857 [Neoarthrinium moseri]